MDIPCLLIHSHRWTFGLFSTLILWIMLLWRFIHTLLCGHTFSFLRYILEVELLCHMVTICLTLWGTTKLSFPKWLYHFTNHPAMYEGSVFPHPCQYLVLPPSLIIAMLVVCETVSLFYTSLMTNSLKQFS